MLVHVEVINLELPVNSFLLQTSLGQLILHFTAPISSNFVSINLLTIDIFGDASIA